MKKFLLLLIFVFLGSLVLAQYNLSFTSEYIDFNLDANYFTINGVYNFRNEAAKPINKKIAFPFAGSAAEVDSVRIVNLNTLENIPFKRNKELVFFYLLVPSDDSVAVNIFYGQHTAKTNRYILKTTKSWGKPLKEAVYNLTVNNELKVSKISMKPDSTNAGSVSMMYYWHKQNFEPFVDFEVTLAD